MSARTGRQMFLQFGPDWHFDLIHGGHSEFVVIGTKNPEYDQVIYEHDHAFDLVTQYAACGGVNVYQSQNGFMPPPNPLKPKLGRTTDRVSALTSCYVDLDVYKVPGLKGIDAQTLLDKACELLPWMPIPTVVISSGRGFYFQWVFTKPLSRDHLYAWQIVENALVQALEPLGADQGVKDAPRVLRVVGTVHGGTGRVVEGNEIQTSGRIPFAQLERAVRHWFVSDAQAEELPKGEPKGKHRPVSDAQRHQYLDWMKLHQLRMDDCHTLAEMRGPKMTDCRRRLSYAYAVSGAWYWSDKRQATYELREFARMHFANPERYTGSDVRNIIELMEQARTGPAMKVWRGQLVPIRFRLTHAEIIRLLNITASEQREMRTIIGPEERQRRRASRRRADGMEPQEAIHNRAEKRRTTVIRMAEQGRKQKDIAKALGITPARVCQLLKAARTSRN
jgi:hypothetical protein